MEYALRTNSGEFIVADSMRTAVQSAIQIAMEDNRSVSVYCRESSTDEWRVMSSHRRAKPKVNPLTIFNN